jgi:hypothetical protein
MITNAIPLLAGMVVKNACSAPKPPADTPMPTIGQKEIGAAGEARGGVEAGRMEDGVV